MPAASSSSSRRSVGLAAITALILPWLTRAGEWAPVAASANSKRDVLGADVAAVDPIGRAGAALDPAGDLDLAERRDRDVAAACRRPARSTSSDTSAKSRAGRSAVPAKMTSSMPAPRIDLGEDSPITQRIASSTLDLPQPFGPDDAGQARLDAAAPPARRSS